MTAMSFPGVSMDPTWPLFPIVSALGFVLVLIPLPWHLEAWNSSTCYFMMWTALACLNQFINSIIWHGNARNPAPIWCDISTRIIQLAAVGIPAASLCINRRLYVIASVKTVSISRAEKRRAILIDTLICVLFPIICVALSYIVQGHRFNILEDIGCATAIFNTLPAYFLWTWWPLLLGLISAVYCILSLLSFAQRRAQFNTLLSSNTSSLTLGRYFRLMALASTELLLSVPLSTFIIYLNLTTTKLSPWVSFANTHAGFSRVDQIPALLWRVGKMEVAVELGRWISPACAFVFFAYFGFADEARRHYREGLKWVGGRLGCCFRRKSSRLSSSSSFGNSGFIEQSEKEKSLKFFSIPHFRKATDTTDTTLTPPLPLYTPPGPTQSIPFTPLSPPFSPSSSSLASSTYHHPSLPPPPSLPKISHGAHFLDMPLALTERTRQTPDTPVSPTSIHSVSSNVTTPSTDTTAHTHIRTHSISSGKTHTTVIAPTASHLPHSTSPTSPTSPFGTYSVSMSEIESLCDSGAPSFLSSSSSSSDGGESVRTQRYAASSVYREYADDCGSDRGHRGRSVCSPPMSAFQIVEEHGHEGASGSSKSSSESDLSGASRVV